MRNRSPYPRGSRNCWVSRRKAKSTRLATSLVPENLIIALPWVGGPSAVRQARKVALDPNLDKRNSPRIASGRNACTLVVKAGGCKCVSAQSTVRSRMLVSLLVLYGYSNGVKHSVRWRNKKVLRVLFVTKIVNEVRSQDKFTPNIRSWFNYCEIRSKVSLQIKCSRIKLKSQLTRCLDHESALIHPERKSWIVCDWSAQLLSPRFLTFLRRWKYNYRATVHIQRPRAKRETIRSDGVSPRLRPLCLLIVRRKLCTGFETSKLLAAYPENARISEMFRYEYATGAGRGLAKIYAITRRVLPLLCCTDYALCPVALELFGKRDFDGQMDNRSITRSLAGKRWDRGRGDQGL